MPLDQAEAIILRSYPIGDQDKIVVFLTHEKGLMKGIAKGARKFGNRFGSSLEPMSLVNIFFYEKEKKDLVTVSNCDLLESFFEILKDLKTSFTCAYFTELIEEFFPSRAREDLIFRLLLSTLQVLKAKRDLSSLTRYFEVWFLQINGWLPDFRRCKKCRKLLAESGWLSPKKDGVYCSACAPDKKEETRPELNTFIHWTKKNPPSQTDSLPFSPKEIKAAQKTLQGIIIYHLEKEPQSLRFLKDSSAFQSPKD
ncbi:MAG: DNA repair protein RecO [Candidatus Aminicenantales bacterium]